MGAWMRLWLKFFFSRVYACLELKRKVKQDSGNLLTLIMTVQNNWNEKIERARHRENTVCDISLMTRTCTKMSVNYLLIIGFISIQCITGKFNGKRNCFCVVCFFLSFAAVFKSHSLNWNWMNRIHRDKIHNLITFLANESRRFAVQPSKQIDYKSFFFFQNNNILHTNMFVVNFVKKTK